MLEKGRRPDYRGRRWWLAAAFLAAVLPASAQYSSGIEATVVDQNGAVIPSAQVILTNEETHVQQTAVSNGQGLVQITHLPPGRYDMLVTAPGFSNWQQNGIDIEGTDVRTVYPKMKPGATQSTVEVNANASSVETTSGTVSRVLEQQTVQHAPLVGENLYASVATLAPE
jgi:hypothetical protein